MKPEEMDFTASVTLIPKLCSRAVLDDTSMDLELKPTWCYGVVLWFDAGFTNQFCRETPTVFSTSPFTPKTHWSQTILTFREPILIGLEGEEGEEGEEPNVKKSGGIDTDACPEGEEGEEGEEPNSKKSGGIGTDACPASNIDLRISIIRAAQHRSIDISMETTGIAWDGPIRRKRSWPVQIFNLS